MDLEWERDCFGTGEDMRREALEMLRQGRQARPFAVTEERLPALPEAVHRYLRSVGVTGKEAIRTVHLKQKGFLRLREGQKWLPLSAEQYFTTDPPAFVWHARVKSLPCVSISVTDMFAHGHGRLRAKLFSAIKITDAHGPEVDQGELLRYLAETVWFPTSWLSDDIRWEGIDAHSAKAILSHAGLTVAAVFHFNDEGQLDGVRAERYREENGKFALRSWSGQMEDYREVAGIRIPMKVRVSWHLETGEFTCFWAELTEIEYNI